MSGFKKYEICQEMYSHMIELFSDDLLRFSASSGLTCHSTVAYYCRHETEDGDPVLEEHSESNVDDDTGEPFNTKTTYYMYLPEVE